MKKNILCIWLSCCLLLFCLCGCGPQENVPPKLTLRFLDVGQGDSALLSTPEHHVLIDAGPESAQTRLCQRLEQLGVRELSLAIFSHPDEDHIGGADGVLSAIPTKEIWLNGSTAENDATKRLTDAAERQGCIIRNVKAGDGAALGALTLSVLYPFSAEEHADSNRGSIVLRVAFGEFCALFTGDAGVEEEALLLSSYGVTHLDCDVYKSGHHGSNTSGSAQFLQAMTPEYAVISCGRDNTYGHPHGGALSIMEQAGATVLRTDLVGEIVLETDGVSVYESEGEN